MVAERVLDARRRQEPGGGWRITRLRIDTIRHEGGEPGRVNELAAQRYAAGLGR